jgi:hypothetical protein
MSQEGAKLIGDRQQQRHDERGDSSVEIEERHPVPAAEPRLDWRRGFLVSDGLLVLLGLWLVASPSAIHYGAGDEKWLPIVAGALIVIAATLALAGVVSRRIAAWAVVGVAALLFIGGLALADSAAASWNAVAGAALAAFLGIVAAASLTGPSAS